MKKKQQTTKVEAKIDELKETIVEKYRSENESLKDDELKTLLTKSTELSILFVNLTSQPQSFIPFLR